MHWFVWVSWKVYFINRVPKHFPRVNIKLVSNLLLMIIRDLSLPKKKNPYNRGKSLEISIHTQLTTQTQNITSACLLPFYFLSSTNPLYNLIKTRNKYTFHSFTNLTSRPRCCVMFLTVFEGCLSVLKR